VLPRPRLARLLPSLCRLLLTRRRPSRRCLCCACLLLARPCRRLRSSSRTWPPRPCSSLRRTGLPRSPTSVLCQSRLLLVASRLATGRLLSALSLVARRAAMMSLLKDLARKCLKSMMLLSLPWSLPLCIS
ncbi:hypothetical protein GGI19_006392, partial [Coemansia pectinata]